MKIFGAPAGFGSNAWLGLWLALLLTQLITGCAHHTTTTPPAPHSKPLLIALAATDRPALTAQAPVFLLDNPETKYNRIGRVVASGSRDNATIAVDTDQPAIYAARRSFATARGLYTNLIYRIHFPELPYSLIPFHLGAGNHVGLLVILTLNADQRVLLVTTANTCGCYAVSIPTAALPVAWYPEDWPKETIPVYGEQFPARLPELDEQSTLLVSVRAEVHRIRDLQVVPKETITPEATINAEMLPLDHLRALPLADGATTSFYYTSGPLAGHVKGAIKPWETLLLSLVSLDLFVGMDKEYGDTQASGNPFYTSLKPWNRSASDMNDFPTYLRFNGWQL